MSVVKDLKSLLGIKMSDLSQFEDGKIEEGLDPVDHFKDLLAVKECGRPLTAMEERELKRLRRDVDVKEYLRSLKNKVKKPGSD